MSKYAGKDLAARRIDRAVARLKRTKRQPDTMLSLARQVIKLQRKPYNAETCDQDVIDFEETAVALARAVLGVGRGR